MFSNTLLTSLVSVTAVLAAPAGSTCQSGATIAGTTCVQECNADRYGGDVAAVQGPSFQACAIACHDDTRCLTAQYAGNGYCYLKSSINNRQDSNSVDGVVCRQPSPSPSSTAPESCPTDVTYTSTSGTRFEYTCGLDYFEGDLRAVYGVATIQACLEECAFEAQCLRATWAKNAHVCYMKNGVTSEGQNEGDWGAMKISSSSSTTTVSFPLLAA